MEEAAAMPVTPELSLFVRIYNLLTPDEQEAFSAIRRVIKRYTGLKIPGDDEAAEEAAEQARLLKEGSSVGELISYGQLLLSVYRQIRRGLVPNEQSLAALEAKLPKAMRAQLMAESKAYLEKAANEPHMSRAALADKVLKSSGRLSRFAILPTDAVAAVKQNARLEYLRRLQLALSRKFLRRSLRTPDQIYQYLMSKDSGVTLSSVSAPNAAVSADTKDDVHIKLEILMGKASRLRAPAMRKVNMDTAGSVFGCLSVLRAHQMSSSRTSVARATQVRSELMGYIRHFSDYRKQKREAAKLMARSCAAKVAAIETRRIQIIEREQRDRMKALREYDMESYVRLVQATKNTRIKELMAKTDKILLQIGAKLEVERAATDRKQQQQTEEQKGGTETTTEGTEGNKDDEQPRKAETLNLRHRIQEKVSQPESMIGGKLMPYQMAGLEFLVSLFNNNLSGILADEMGLGKTIQTIALLSYLKEVKHNNGPHLVAVPLSTLPNWANEFEKWCPSLRVLQYRGNKLERRVLNSEVRKQKYNVLLTTFEFILREHKVLSFPRWKFIIVDEGHKMKNYKSKFHSTLGDFKSQNRVLLTGTPLQNNLQELWSLLNFLMPHTFSSSDEFDRWFEEPFRDQFVEAAREDVSLTEEEKLLVINRLHMVLRPFLLRRVKADVLSDLPSKREYTVRVQLSRWQQLVYAQLVNRCLKVRDSSGKITSKSVANVIMQLRKVVNHPYLFLDEYKLDENLWRVAGKFEVLDRMLPKLLEFKHKILIFCQMTQVMDILGDYLSVKNMKFHRLDGSMMVQDRQDRMDDFNDPTSDTHVFMLSTRAGGLGLNLQAADTVILFDSDWNPHQDLQAQARAHRVGQKNEVRVFRLVTVSPVEELILAKAQHKLSIDERIIQAGMFSGSFNDDQREQRLRELLSAKGEVEHVRVTSPQELNRFMARNDQEDEAFAAMDTDVFGPDIWRQFYDDFDESEGPPSQSAGTDNDANSSESAKVETSPSSEASGESPLRTAPPAKDSGRIEELLIASGRLVADDEIPTDILLVQDQPKDEESFFTVQMDLGVRRSRLRATQAAETSAKETSEEEAAEPEPEPESRTTRSSRRKRKLDS